MAWYQIGFQDQQAERWQGAVAWNQKSQQYHGILSHFYVFNKDIRISSPADVNSFLGEFKEQAHQAGIEHFEISARIREGLVWDRYRDEQWDTYLEQRGYSQHWRDEFFSRGDPPITTCGYKTQSIRSEFVYHQFNYGYDGRIDTFFGQVITVNDGDQISGPHLWLGQKAGEYQDAEQFIKTFERQAFWKGYLFVGMEQEMQERFCHNAEWIKSIRAMGYPYTMSPYNIQRESTRADDCAR